MVWKPDEPPIRPEEAPLKLYEVVRWGNDSPDPFTGGPDGHDTIFLVRAGSVEQAVRMVDPRFRTMPHERVRNWAAAVYELGADGSGELQPRILRGPYVEHASRCGWRHWYRHEPDAPWEEHLDK